MTAPVPVLERVPLLVIFPPKVKGELLEVEMDPVLLMVRLPVNVLVPPSSVSVRAPAKVVEPVTVRLFGPVSRVPELRTRFSFTVVLPASVFVWPLPVIVRLRYARGEAGNEYVVDP